MIELVLSCALFAALGILLFGTLHFGFRAFTSGNQRMGGQSQMEVILAQLKRDLELTTFTSLQLESGVHRQVLTQRPEGETREDRCVLALVGLDNWLDSQRYDLQTGLPRWNRYWLYQADLKRPQGSLSRLEILPGNALTNTGTRWRDWDTYISIFPDEPPNPGPLAESQLVQRKTLTRQLAGFGVELSASQVFLTLRLTWQGRKSPTGQKRTEVHEVRLRVVPRNRVR